MAPEWQTASEGLEAGAPIFDGTDPHIAIDAALNRGFLAVKDCPFSFATDGFNVPAIWANYLTTTDAQAILYKPGSVYSVSPDYDSIKEALFQANAENGVVMAFGYRTRWSSPALCVFSVLLDRLIPGAREVAPSATTASSADWFTICRFHVYRSDTRRLAGYRTRRCAPRHDSPRRQVSDTLSFTPPTGSTIPQHTIRTFASCAIARAWEN
jgi:hypothetical protein